MTNRQQMINRIQNHLIINESKIDDMQMNGLVERLAANMGMMEWYMNLTDKQYFRMVNEARRTLYK